MVVMEAQLTGAAASPAVPGSPTPTSLRSEATSLRSVVHHAGFVDHLTSLEQVQRVFAEKQVDFLALVHDGIVTGICSRLRLGNLLGSRFGFALYSRSAAHVAQVEHPIVFNETTPVRQVLDTALARHGDEFHEDVVLVDAAQRLIGLIPVDALARLQTRLVAEQVDELRRQHLELFQAGHALRQSQGLYLGLFEGHTLGVALLDVDGVVHGHNRRLAELLTSGPAPVEIASLTAWVVESDRPAFLALLQAQARQAAPPGSQEFTLKIPGRGARQFRCSTGWIRETGEICACLDDVTEQRTLERQLGRQEKQTLLDTLVGGIAHELNNKLTPVQGFSQLIELHTDEQTRIYAGLISKSVKEAAKIIQQLLQLSKPGSTITQTVDFRSIVEEALTMLRFQIRETGCAVKAKLPPDPIWIRSDPAQIKQVVLNLALNALQATEDENFPEITLEVSTSDSRATLVVSDNGVGIPTENLNRIFDPFFTTKGPERGTGLGLSVCFSIVRQNGGEITVESVPGSGAKFSVALPLETAMPLALDLRDDDSNALLLRNARRGARVLIVEDEIVVARLMHEIFHTQFGCDVDVVNNGLAAFEKLADNRYTLIVSDVRMPEMNGTELFLWLREAQPASARRFVFVTGHAGEKHFEAEIAQWGVPVIAKPFTMTQLISVCAPFLESASSMSA
jgi:signal transduction histidine kinase